MRESEARYIGSLLAEIPDEQLSPMINLGSSTVHFRQVVKPHIDRFVFAPLRQRGIEVVHADIKPDRDVRIAGDFFDPAVQAEMRAVGARMLLCNNVLEQVERPAALAGVAASLVARGSLLLASVPCSYPYHADPIDRLFRPTADELAALFSDCRVLKSRTIEDTSAWPDIRRRGLTRLAIRLMAPFWRPKVWLYHVHNLMWLLRPYRISCVLLEKTA